MTAFGVRLELVEMKLVGMAEDDVWKRRRVGRKLRTKGTSSLFCLNRWGWSLWRGSRLWEVKKKRLGVCIDAMFLGGDFR